MMVPSTAVRQVAMQKAFIWMTCTEEERQHITFSSISPLRKVFSAADLKGAQPGGQRPDGPGADHVEAGQVVHHGQEVDVGVQLYVRVKRSVEKFSLSSFDEVVVQAIYGRIRYWYYPQRQVHYFHRSGK